MPQHATDRFKRAAAPIRIKAQLPACASGHLSDDHLGRVWGLDSNVMDAMLIGAIQQLVARNTELAARITQLERRKH